MMLLDGLAYIGKRRTQMLMKIQGKSFKCLNSKGQKIYTLRICKFSKLPTSADPL